jgi:hypothetical protein
MMKRFAFAALAALGLAATMPAQADVKWHPGHYLTLDANSPMSTHFKNIDEIGGVAAIKGVQLRLWWAQWETSKGVYNYALIDSYINKLKSMPTPKRLVVRIEDRRYGTSKTGILPGYLLTESTYKGGLVATKYGYVARIWEQPMMDRLIAAGRAMGARYDKNPYFEGLALEETAIPFSTVPSSYSPTVLRDQLIRFAAQVRPVMPQTNLFFNTNYLSTVSVMDSLIQKMLPYSIGVGGPNVFADMTKLTHGQKVWIGQTGANYRGRLAIGNGVENVELGGGYGNYTPKQLGDFAYQKLGVTHMFWPRNEWNGTSAQRWSTGILPYLKTNPPVVTACPWAYGICIK